MDDEITLGTQITSPHGAGIVQWIEGPMVTVKIYHEDGIRVLDREHIAFWPPRVSATVSEVTA